MFQRLQGAQTPNDGNITTMETSFPGLELGYFLVTNIGTLVVICFGLPGNLMAFLVATKKSNSHLSTCKYMAGLALADSIVLLNLTCINVLLFWKLGKDIFLDRRFMYRLFYYVAYSAGISSGLFLAEMSVDRLIAVWAPMKAASLCTTSRAKKLMAVTSVVTFGLNLNMFWTFDYRIDPISGTELLEPYTPDAPYQALLSTTYQLTFGTIIPFLVIFSCNVAIIIGVQRAAGKRNSMVTTTKDKGRAEESKYMMRMLVLVSLAYVFCSIPMRMYDVVLDMPGIREMYDLKQPYWFLRYNLEYWVCGVIWDANYGINFYMYCLGGGSKFRNDALDVFQKCIQEKSRMIKF